MLRISLAPVLLVLTCTWSVPLYSQTPWRDYSGDDAGDQVGWDIARLRDVNGDGVPDYAVGAPQENSPLLQAGRVRLYSGANGVVLHEWVGAAVGEQVGSGIADVGDFDGDGRADLALGIRFYGPINNRVGAVRVVSSATGASLMLVLGTQSEARFGSTVAGLGDVNGDGHADFAVGSPFHDQVNATEVGLVTVVSGSNGTVLWTRSGSGLNAMFGWEVADAGDLDGDGVHELLVGAPGDSVAGDRTGMVSVHRGQDGSVLRSVSGDQLIMQFGFSVASAGDVDGDGRSEFVAGAPSYDVPTFGQKGLARMYSGATGAQLFEWQGSATTERLGTAVDGGADFNGDGRPDVLLGSSGTPSGGPRVTRLVDGWTGAVLSTVTSPLAVGGYTSSAAVLGDLDGDSRSEFAVGLPWAVIGPNNQAGNVTVYRTCVPPEVYCTAKVNSAGCAPSVQVVGSTSLSTQNDLHVVVTGLINQSVALMAWSRSRNATPFGGGTLCILPPLRRTPLRATGGNPPGSNDCSGSASYWFEQSYALSQGLRAGDRVCCQFWSRDALSADGTGLNLSNAVEFTWCP